MGEAEYVALSTSDVSRIETELYPKANRTLWKASGVALGLCIVLPFVGGRRSRPLVEQMSYPAAFCAFVLLFGSFMVYLYWKTVRGLKGDLGSGFKCVFKTRVAQKVWKDGVSFELKLEEQPGLVAKRRFTYPAAESHCFHEGDVVVIECLERSAVVLRVFAEV